MGLEMIVNVSVNLGAATQPKTAPFNLTYLERKAFTFQVGEIGNSTSGFSETPPTETPPTDLCSVKPHFDNKEGAKLSKQERIF